jgi:hypothetical protein
VRRLQWFDENAESLQRLAQRLDDLEQFSLEGATGGRARREAFGGKGADRRVDERR